MKERNISQAVLGNKIGKAQCQVSKYCNGEVLPNLATAMKISEVLSVSLDDLCKGTVVT